MHEAVDLPKGSAEDQEASLPAPRDIAVISFRIIVEAHLPGPEINVTSLIAGVVDIKE